MYKAHIGNLSRIGYNGISATKTRIRKCLPFPKGVPICNNVY